MEYEAMSTSTSFTIRGFSRFVAAFRPPARGRPADSVLHAAGARRRLVLRGYSSRRFRDQNSLLLQAEWRIMVNRYLDLAFFYDTGKVAAPDRTSTSMA